MDLFIKIALPLPTTRLFTYSVPGEMLLDSLVGRRALVPLGKRTITGFIVEQSETTEIKNVKPIIEVLDSEPIFSKKMLTFTRFLGEYYFSSWGEVLKAALPQGMSPKSVIKVNILQKLGEEELLEMARTAPKRSALMRLLMDHDDSVSVSYLEKQLNSESVALQLEFLEKSGLIKTELMVTKDTKPKFQKAIKIASNLLIDKDSLRLAFEELDKVAPRQSILLSHVYLHEINNSEPVLLSEAIRDVKTSPKTVSDLAGRNYVNIIDVEIDRSLKSTGNKTLIQRDETNLRLTPEQDHAVMKVSEAMDRGGFKAFLLHGVTGSGKTLVYIRAMKHALALGKSVLLLVPEIALTPQLIDRFHAVFEDRIAVMHSRMSQGERYDAWRSIYQGTCQIVLGARSALFAPLQNLGLIIVDEEHEPSYKQESPAPRYNARDAAVIRGSHESAVVVLGSATPSLESMNNAHTGKYHLLEITERADKAKMPAIRVVDVHKERRNKQMIGSFTRELVAAIIDRVEKKEGVILFQNRRGFSVLLECPDCSYVPMCKYCDVTLTYHKHKNQLRCHYCGYSVQEIRECPNCGYPELREIGYGTQRIEDELREILEKYDVKAVIDRMDLDTTSKRDSHRHILTNFARGDTDILVGTQMVAKGLDFERVTLVGVMNADVMLFLPDFRASERAFQLLTQVSGRAGRSSERPGEVIIQTAHSKNHAVLSASLGSYDMFYGDEIQHRKEADYPPFSRFIVIEFQGRDESKVIQHARMFSEMLPSGHPAIDVLGPASPTVSRIRLDHRRILVVKNKKSEDPNGKALRAYLQKAYINYKKKHSTSAIRMTVDIDSFSGI